VLLHTGAGKAGGGSERGEEAQVDTFIACYM
jgi:hypothetical protein